MSAARKERGRGAPRGLALLIGWPLRSVSPVSLARGARPRRTEPSSRRGTGRGGPSPATRTGAPISANPGRRCAEPPGPVCRSAAAAGCAGGQFALDGAQQPDLSGHLGSQFGERHRRVITVKLDGGGRSITATGAPGLAPAGGGKTVVISSVSLARPAASRARGGQRSAPQHRQVGLADVTGQRGHRHQLPDQVLDPHLVLSWPAWVSRSQARTRRSSAAASAPGSSSRCSPPGRPAASGPASPRRSRSTWRAGARTGAGPRPWPRTPGRHRGPRRAKNTAIGIHAGPVGSNTTASRVPSGAPASAARSTTASDSTVGTHDDRHTTCPSASSTRTECREAIPRSIPTRRRVRPPVLLLHPPPLPLHRRTSQLRRHSRQQPIGHGPRSAGARQRLPLMCCNRTRPRSGLVHFPHAGHPWPGQQWQSNPRGPAPRRPQNLRRRHLPDQPGMLMQPWNPRADQAPEFLT